MPQAFERKLKARGGAVRWRTRSLPNNEFQRCAVVRKPGKRGGHVLCEEPRKRMRR